MTNDRPSENPPDDKLTRADRLAGTPAIVWGILGFVVIVAFSLLVFWVMSVRPH